MNWKSTARRDDLKKRATVLDDIRSFFKKRGVLEVETPLLCQHTVTDRYIDSFSIDGRYLQTSPEYAMKRLLASGSGPIFQIGKAFRKEESGQQHNPEFTLLEWYRPGFTHHDLLDEIDALLGETLGLASAKRTSYQSLFQQYCGINPLNCDTQLLKAKLSHVDVGSLGRDDCLQLLFNENIEPHLGFDEPCFVIDFPASQAALARLNPKNPLISERFEVFIQGKEIANGFHELTDANEQARRFKADQAHRKEANQFVPDIDPRFIAALKSGLPDCAGVALGVDRLLMSLSKRSHIKEVLSFDWENA